MNKRDILVALLDGKQLTINDIVESSGTAVDVKSTMKARTNMGRLFKEGLVCEVIPREGRLKLWMDVYAALNNRDDTVPPVHDNKRDVIIITSRIRPDKYVVTGSWQNPMVD